jgi:surface-anchored protein
LHIHNEDTDTEYAPDEAILQLKPSSQQSVPNDSRYSFLGNPGDPIWILPQVQNPDLIVLGLAAEEIASGTFLNDELTITLSGFGGPGHFFLYQADAFQNPMVWMNTNAGGVSSADSVTIPTGGHSDFNWAFSAPGIYQLTFTATAQLPDTTTVSDSATYTFEVVPEPTSVGLLSLGGILLALRRTRARRTAV